MQPVDVIAATAPQMVKTGSSFYFRPATVAVAKEHGLNGMNFYVAGRGGVLGNANATAVRAAFGYFHPDVIAKLWDSAAEVMEAARIAELFVGAAHTAGRELFSDLDQNLLADFVEAAAAVIAVPEGVAMALFSGVRDLPVPDDVPAAAIHQAMVLREMRGDAHLVSVVAAGLPTEVAHAINRPKDVELFGWSEPIEPTDDQRRQWDAAEAMTNRLVEPAYAVLTEAQAETFSTASQAMFEAIS